MSFKSLGAPRGKGSGPEKERLLLAVHRDSDVVCYPALLQQNFAWTGVSQAGTWHPGWDNHTEGGLELSPARCTQLLGTRGHQSLLCLPAQLPAPPHTVGGVRVSPWVICSGEGLSSVGFWAPTMRSCALQALQEELPGGGGTWGPQAEACCVCDTRPPQEIPRQGLGWQLYLQSPISTAPSSSGCTTAPGPAWPTHLWAWLVPGKETVHLVPAHPCV